MSLLARSNGFQASLDHLEAVQASSQPWFGRVLKKKIIVHTRDSQSIEGVLMEELPDGIILRAASLLGDGGRRTPMAGEIHVPRENISFSQLDE